MADEENFRGLYDAAPESFAAAYPEVPSPHNTLSPNIVAARWAVHDIYGEDMPLIAVDLLEVGYDTPSLRQLAGETSIKNSADAEPLVNAMLRELGISQLPSEEEAKLLTSRQIAREVIAGLRNPWAAASHLEIVVWSWDSENADVLAIFAIHDEINWERAYRRSLPELKTALLDAFSRLALLP